MVCASERPIRSIPVIRNNVRMIGNVVEKAAAGFLKRRIKMT